MLAIKNKYTVGKSQDTEMIHIKFDEYICEVLKSYGFHKGVEVFKDTELWYS
jgi:ribosomal protein S8